MSRSVWRIVKAKHAKSAFTGDGAREFGGRWNSPGVAVVYTAGSVSLAILEMLVHLREDLLSSYVLIEANFDEKLIRSVDNDGLPESWRKSPPPRAVQNIADQWVAQSSSAVLRVPSVIVPSESNYLLNPVHADFKLVDIGSKKALDLDVRLLKSARQ